jgi:Helicase associated domain
MSEERVKVLEDIGFVWDSQGAAWEERLGELKEFRAQNQHCNVPTNFRDNPQLASWVKCQRRQYKLYLEGQPSNITPRRIERLEELGFEWELRPSKKRKQTGNDNHEQEIGPTPIPVSSYSGHEESSLPEEDEESS